MGKLDAAAWPASASVDSLRDELEALKKKGVKDPFVYVELGLWFIGFSFSFHCCLSHLGKRMTPQWALPLHAASKEGGDGASPYLRICFSYVLAYSGGQRVSFGSWVSCFLRFSVAAEAVGMFPMTAALAHLDICLRLGEEARAQNKSPIITPTYDEVCRKHWAECSRAGVQGFSAKHAALAEDRVLVGRAEAQIAQKALQKHASATKVCFCSALYVNSFSVGAGSSTGNAVSESPEGCSVGWASPFSFQFATVRVLFQSGETKWRQRKR